MRQGGPTGHLAHILPLSNLICLYLIGLEKEYPVSSDKDFALAINSATSVFFFLVWLLAPTFLPLYSNKYN